MLYKLKSVEIMPLYSIGNVAMCKYIRGENEVTLPMWDRSIENIPKTVDICKETVPLKGTYRRIATNEKVTDIEVAAMKLNEDIYLDGKYCLKPIED
jgi:hypothetical protein